MASREPGGDSSSPNADLHIERVEKRGAGRDRVRLHLSDGSSLSILEDVYAEHGLGRGSAIDPRRMQSVLDDSMQREARRTALRLVARSPQTRAGLKRKLLKRGFAPAACESAIDRMAELGYVDDQRFAEQWLEIRLQRHDEGRAALIAGLARRGVPRAAAEQTVERMVPRESEEQALRRAIQRYGGRLSGRRLAARLAAAGFPADMILRALPELDHRY
jgi:regulatory protein